MSETFNEVAAPLLELLHRVSGLETTFVTRIDWDHQIQEVVLSLNKDDLAVETGSQLPWADSMCRWTFLSGRAATMDVPSDFRGSLGAEVLGMQTFVAVPILADDQVVGTVCGASRHVVPVPDETVEIVALVATALTHQFQAEIEVIRQRDRADRAEELALTDDLTGLANRRGFTARLEEELARAGRHHRPIAVLVVDVDAFKAVNDGAGHAAGDEVLVALGAVLSAGSRAQDIAGRLGGDEFALVLPDTNATDASHVADRIREAFAEATEALARPATISIGVASSERSALRDLLADADRALYEQKARRAEGRTSRESP